MVTAVLSKLEAASRSRGHKANFTFSNITNICACITTELLYW